MKHEDCRQSGSSQLRHVFAESVNELVSVLHDPHRRSKELIKIAATIRPNGFQNPSFLYATARRSSSYEGGATGRSIQAGQILFTTVLRVRTTTLRNIWRWASPSAASSAEPICNSPSPMPTCTLVSMGPAETAQRACAAGIAVAALTSFHFRSPQAIFYYFRSESVLNKTTCPVLDELPPKPHECHEYDENPSVRKAWCCGSGFRFIQTAEEFEHAALRCRQDVRRNTSPRSRLHIVEKYYVTNAQCP